MVVARGQDSQDQLNVLEGLAACSPATFVATAASLLKERQQAARPSRSRVPKAQKTQPVSYHLQILKLAQLRLKEQLPEEHLLALTKTAADALNGLQADQTKLQCKPHDLIIQRYSIVRLLVAKGHFETGLSQAKLLRSELAAHLTALAEGDSADGLGANEVRSIATADIVHPVASQAASASLLSQDTYALALGSLLSLLKCTIETASAPSLLQDLKLLELDMASAKAWLRYLPLQTS